MEFEFFLLILAMASVIYVSRVLPLLLFAGKQLNPVFTQWLGFIPVTVLSALLAPQLLVNKGTLFLSTENVFLLAAIPTWIIGWLTKSFFGTIATGLIFTAGLRWFFS